MTEPTSRDSALGHWAYRHRDFFNSQLGWFSVKQVARSFIASFAMMLTAIPTVFGIDLLKSAGEKGKLGLSKALNENVAMAAGSPLRAILFVATGFTMYRGTTKIFNKLYERVFNPANDERKTVEEVAHLPQHLKEAVREVMPAESQSTTFGAIALGGIRSLYDPTKVEAAHRPVPGNAVRDVILHPKGKFKQQAAIDILGYSAFFELSDRLYKDVQLRRDQWKGQPNSIATIKHSAMDESAPPGTDDPTFKRLVFRRIVPTAMGITAYTLTHRLSKMATGAPAKPEIGDGALTMAKKFAHSFTAEWAAIGTFFIHSAIAEKYEKAYDALFERIQHKQQEKQHAIA